jgi:hypothetical protein
VQHRVLHVAGVGPEGVAGAVVVLMRLGWLSGGNECRCVSRTRRNAKR